MNNTNTLLGITIAIGAIILYKMHKRDEERKKRKNRTTPTATNGTTTSGDADVDTPTDGEQRQTVTGKRLASDKYANSLIAM